MSNKLCNLLQSTTTPNAKLLTCLGAAAVVFTAIKSNYQQQPTQAEKKKERDNIEVNLMDHIANKRKFIVICTYDIHMSLTSCHSCMFQHTSTITRHPRHISMNSRVGKDYRINLKNLITHPIIMHRYKVVPEEYHIDLES